MAVLMLRSTASFTLNTDPPHIYRLTKEQYHSKCALVKLCSALKIIPTNKDLNSMFTYLIKAFL
jgi:hypothetical protein